MDRSIYYWKNQRPVERDENNEVPEWIPSAAPGVTPAMRMSAFDGLPALLRGFLNYSSIMWCDYSVARNLKHSASTQMDIIKHIRDTELKATGHVAAPPKRQGGHHRIV